MTNVNVVVLQGNLTKDASEGMRRGANDTAFGSFTLAVNRSVKAGDKWEDITSYIKVKGFGKGYENAVKWLTKGSSATVEGYLEQESWEKDGQKRSEVVVVANKIYPTYKKGEGGNKPKENSAPTNEQGDLGFPEDMPF